MIWTQTSSIRSALARAWESDAGYYIRSNKSGQYLLTFDYIERWLGIFSGDSGFEEAKAAAEADLVARTPKVFLVTMTVRATDETSEDDVKSEVAHMTTDFDPDISVAEYTVKEITPIVKTAP